MNKLIERVRQIPLWKAAIGTWMAVTMVGQSMTMLDRFRAPTAPGPHITVNDSTQAQLAAIRIEKGELQGLVDAEKTLHGKLVAGFQITVKGDTLVRLAASAPTVVRPDSSRHATLTDTTKGYTIVVDAEAPPFPANLQLGYHVTTPDFKPQVGFVKRDDGYYAVATWAGQTFTTDHAFFAPEKPHALSLLVGGEMSGSPAANIAGFSLGGSAFAALQYQHDRGIWQLKAGENGKPFVGLAYTHRLF